MLIEIMAYSRRADVRSLQRYKALVAGMETTNLTKMLNVAYSQY